MGLEALVHAASQEHKRISSSRPVSAVDDKRMSASPVLDRGSGYLSPNRQHRVDEQMKGLTFDNTDVQSGEFNRRGPTLVPVHAVEARPIKRQRLSDPLSGLAGVAERERTFGTRYGDRQTGDSLPRRLSGPGAHEYQVNDRAILGIGVAENSKAILEDKVTPRKTSSGKHVGRANNPSRPQTPRDTDSLLPVKVGVNTASSQTKEQIETKEQDAHDWLLDHYVGNTPSAIPTNSASSSMAKTRGGRTQIDSDRTAVHGPRVSAERTLSRTPAPEIAKAIGQELEAAIVSSKRGPVTDPDVALELVAESLDAEEGPKSSRASMEVEDELLSLIDDPTPPVPPRRFAPVPPALRLTKPLTPTVVTVSSPVKFTSPAPASPFMDTPGRESMPPPGSSAFMGNGDPGRRADQEASSSSTAGLKGKKAGAAKACIYWFVFFCHLTLQLYFSPWLNRNNPQSLAQRLLPKQRPKLLQRTPPPQLQR